MPRLGQVTMSYKPIRGGAETYLANLYRILEEAGYDQRVYQPNTGIYDPELRLVPKLGMRLSPIPNYNISLVMHQLSNLRHEDRLVVHYPEHYPPVSWHRRVVTLTHGVNWDFDSSRKKMVLQNLAKWSFQHSWRFVANDTNFLRQVGVAIEPKTHLYQEVAPGRWFIPNAIDVTTFQSGKARQDLVKLRPILVPRNFSYPRGVDMAVEAFALIANKFKDVHLVLVGDALPTPDSQQYKQELVKRIEELGLTKRVILYGSVPWKDMPDIYASGLCTLIPTRGNEGTSLAALESMAAGKPTVTTSVAGLRDLPTYQVDPDPKSIAEGLKEIIRQPDHFAVMQQQEVEQTYNLEKWKQAWLEVVR